VILVNALLNFASKNFQRQETPEHKVRVALLRLYGPIRRRFTQGGVVEPRRRRLTSLPAPTCHNIPRPGRDG
jgi:hypothetical protein